MGLFMRHRILLAGHGILCICRSTPADWQEMVRKRGVSLGKSPDRLVKARVSERFDSVWQVSASFCVCQRYFPGSLWRGLGFSVVRASMVMIMHRTASVRCNTMCVAIWLARLCVRSLNAF